MIRLPIANGDLAALIVSTSFAAGLNVYATVATLGLLGHYQMVVLPDALNLITSWWVIGTAGVLFAIEFVADKIPAFDLIWNALHTFVRVPVAALMAWGATSHLSPQMQMLATIAGGLIAFAAHGGKTAARAAVTPSPEPISNMALSMGEDVTAVGLTWVATQHPYWGAGFVVLALAATLLLMRWVIKAMKKLFSAGPSAAAPVQ